MTKKTVIVTGGSRGIGKSIAKTLLTKGYVVHIVAKDIISLQSAVKELSEYGDCEYSVVDFSDQTQIQLFLNKWDRPLYGLVNNAGICKTERIDESLHVWDEVLQVNLHAPYTLIKGLLPFIVDYGRIVNISSQLGKEGRAGYSAYCASKFGLIGITKCIAKEVGVRGVTVNAICPGWVATDMSVADTKRLAKENNVSFESYYQQICSPLELKRFTSPDEVAHFVNFLMSEEASGITGRDYLLNTVWNQE